VIVILLFSIMIMYSGHLLIELRSYLLTQALFIDLEREQKNHYTLHGALYYGAVLYKQHRTTWQLPYTFTYKSIKGENITLEFTNKITRAGQKQVALKATVQEHEKIHEKVIARCVLQELPEESEHDEPEIAIFIKFKASRD
jgi:hypothetical protein